LLHSLERLLLCRPINIPEKIDMSTRARHAARGCPGFRQTNTNRRGFLQVGATSALGLGLGDYLALRGGEPSRGAAEPPARNVIQIFLPGGCGHQESWDPKPEAPIEYRGPLGVAKTKLPGVVFSETMPRCGQIIDKLTVIRSVTAKVPDHGLGQYHALTGYTQSPAIQHPQMGAIVSHELGGMNDLPAWIGVPNGISVAGTGYLPAKFGCFNVAGDPGAGGFQVRDVGLAHGVSPHTFETRRSLRSMVESHFRSLETDGAALETMNEFYRQAYALVSSPQAQAAFTIDAETADTRRLYGCGQHVGMVSKQSYMIGERLILSRRLIEAGARFVSVNYEGVGWDAHARIKECFVDAMPAFDHALAGLVTDLDQRGLLDSTLVMVMTEFGRSPKVNSSAGRDHHAKCFSLVLAGGGITRGQVYGESDSIAAEPARDAVPLEDFLATCYHQLGIDPDKRLMAPGDRPIDIVRGGKIVKGIIA